MTLYIFDTDHLSLYGRNHAQIITRLQSNQKQIATTAINVGEQLKGRLAQVADARDGAELVKSYQYLMETIMLLNEFQTLPYSLISHQIYQSLRSERLRIGTQDLRIAAIALAHDGILLTRNLCDFEKVPKLMVQDWSI